MELTDFKPKIKQKKLEIYEAAMDEHNLLFRNAAPENVIVSHLDTQKKKISKLADAGIFLDE